MIGLKYKWWKREAPQWHWWYRFKKPAHTIYTPGCFNNNHDYPDDEGCPCNKFYQARRELEAKGYVLVAAFDGLNVYANCWRVIVFEYHSYGR